eukprot:g9914.t1
MVVTAIPAHVSTPSPSPYFTEPATEITDRPGGIPAVSSTAHIRGKLQPAHRRGHLTPTSGEADLQVLPLAKPLPSRAPRGVEWPESLKELTFGRCFNQPVEDVRWPSSLPKLKFGGRFNQSVKGRAWPASLQEVAFSGRFGQPIAGIRWPPYLKRLTFGPPGGVDRRGFSP